jgi:hypothetical protein
MLKLVIALVLLAHGIGHVLGLLQVFKVATVNPAWNGESWLLTGIVGTGPSQLVGVALWVASIIGFVALAAVTVGWLPAEWWPPLAIGASLASLAGLLLFPLAFPTTSTIGAALIDVAVLVAGLRYALTDATI